MQVEDDMENEKKIRALLIYPKFPSDGLWNNIESSRLMGARYSDIPLALITVAAYLPSNWDIRLVDLNIEDNLDEKLLAWADFTFISVMLPQRQVALSLINKISKMGKKVVVGGPDPSSVPHLYQQVDYLFVGEVENTFSLFLKDINDGKGSGRYQMGAFRPDLSLTPTPRFDLLKIDRYLQLSLQFSRGCPYNCEFCDAIAMFGRVPRTKTVKQFLTELGTIYNLGYRGPIFITDDNFIGNSSRTKELLRVLLQWNRKHKNPFFYITEASLNLAYDEELLELMRLNLFRYIFIGLESPDSHVLSAIEKKQNASINIHEAIDQIQRAGIIVVGSFILGFDNEQSDCGEKMLRFIEDQSIVIAQVGLLDALPRTRFTKRLQEEGRLFEHQEVVGGDQKRYAEVMSAYGLNFQTKRAREDILRDQHKIISTIYHPQNYFNRCLSLGLKLNILTPYKPSFKNFLKFVRSFFYFSIRVGIFSEAFRYFLRNIVKLAYKNPKGLELTFQLMGMYLHYQKHLPQMLAVIEEQLG